MPSLPWARSSHSGRECRPFHAWLWGRDLAGGQSSRRHRVRVSRVTQSSEGLAPRVRTGSSGLARAQVLDNSNSSGSPYKAVVGSDSWAIALTVEELQSFVQARSVPHRSSR